jgi:hypothetical protein
MNNSKKLEKSRGVVVFAFNTEVDYVGIADQTSRLVRHNLELPITLITDHDANPVFDYDNIIRIDPLGDNYRTGESTIWRNFGRYYAYELSPYDETILLDVDYLVLDDNLLKLFETEWDYKLMRHNTDERGDCSETMGYVSLPFVWATVLLFRKRPRTQLLFDMVGRIQRNYNYYRLLYNIGESNFRNDYAFSIADIILSGYNVNELAGIPWKMFTLTNKLTKLVYDATINAYFENANPLVLPKQSIHVMDKHYLQTPEFKLFVEAACAK